ncbi:MAG: hypothetical protein A2008_03320 [Candidatus Wallbacteria bacterium GWC2_49_35]|uniref:DUF5666 domain-containing protein n=1 Tax=Candidatus Wallbacteria bacterium GWC2_49_35 TaxID=1817813 RepID=A0A1F7WM60_9BACT|nr:MAG: hypothetical protein A2008_03320 [Candidatus Wallbacteria bacterium GWC2_49_35]HBC73504.1 hypothetical protein [Candidatus Wallbacteria bacterium]
MISKIFHAFLIFILFAAQVPLTHVYAEPSGGVADGKVLFTAVGAVRQVKTVKKESRPVYELVDEKGEKYKLIGPKAIVDQILAVKDYGALKFTVAGQLRLSKEDRKKGILMSGFEIYKQPATPPVNAGDPATAENALKNAPDKVPAGTVENKVK